MMQLSSEFLQATLLIVFILTMTYRETDQPWEVFGDKLPEFDREKAPKPDAVFFLPIYDTDSTIAPDTVAFRNIHWGHLPHASMVDSFSWSTLNTLNMLGLEPGPRRICNKDTRARSASQLRCYPWLIAEFKKAHARSAEIERAAEIVCCQASNAAACALKLNRELAKFASPLANEGHVLPLPAVTTNGSSVTIWIAYYAKGVARDRRFGFLGSSESELSDAYVS